MSATEETRPAPRFKVGDILESGEVVTEVTWQPEHARYWVNTRRNGQPFSGGPEWFHVLGKRAPKSERASATNEPDDGPLIVARFLTIWAGLMFLIWLGAFLERTDWADLGALIWYASGCLLFALGFMLYFWGARSATRRAAKDEEANR